MGVLTLQAARNKFNWARLGVWVAALGLAGAIVGVQYFYDHRVYTEIKKQFNAQEYNVLIEPYTLNSTILKKISFGFENTIADINWLLAIQYYGGGSPYGYYRQLPGLFNNTTDLDPKFEYPYVFSEFVLPFQKDFEKSRDIALKGMQNVPSSWEIPYYLGTNYHVYKKDFVNAAKYVDLASQVPGAPSYYRFTAALYFSKTDEKIISYNIYLDLYNNAKDDKTKQRAKDNLDDLDAYFTLQKAADIYKQKYGHNLENIDQLVKAKILKEIPQSPFKREYTVKDGQITS